MTQPQRGRGFADSRAGGTTEWGRFAGAYKHRIPDVGIMELSDCREDRGAHHTNSIKSGW